MDTANKERGFTLVELLVVIGIIAALAAVVIPNVARFVGAGDDEANNTEFATIQASVDLYMARWGLDAGGLTPGSTPPALRDWTNIEPDGNGHLLYPDFMRQQITKCNYAWNTNGLVAQASDCVGAATVPAVVFTPTP